MLDDLAKSGITSSTAEALQIRPVPQETLRASGFPLARAGYLIPYFDVQGERITEFCRIKLTPAIEVEPGKIVKYVQPPNSTTHAFLPKQIPASIWLDPEIPIIITEGEKKAIAAAQAGLVCMAIGGVDSWHTRTFKLKAPEIQRESAKSKNLVVKLTDPTAIEELHEQIVAEFLQLPWDGRKVFLCFDTEQPFNVHVQRALFELAVWLMGEGASVKQVLLPPGPDGSKMGLDDYLLTHTPQEFWTLPQVAPTHPKIRAYIRNQLDRKKTSRSDQVKVAAALLSALDNKGQRYVEPNTGNFYYWEAASSTLHAFRWDANDIRQLRLSSFGTHLQQEYGIGTSDEGVVKRLADIYGSFHGIKPVTPRRVSWAGENALYYQLSDSEVAKVTAQSITTVSNGTDDVLFLANQVAPLSLPADISRRPLGVPRWLEALGQVNLEPMPDMTLEETHIFLAVLFYLSPMFRHWRGMMLPIELAVAEPNSGKSFLYNLRRGIMVGRPGLDNPPISVRDWYAQLVAAPAMWICDNLGEVNREMRDLFSDELARLVTDPNPSIEMRKLYSTVESGRWPVDACFAITSIRNPFHKADIMQRAIVLAFKAIEAEKRDSMWYQRQITEEGRLAWVVDHLQRAQLFFQSVSTGWRDDYLSSHRLVHFEQALLHMGAAIGKGPETAAVVGKLFGSVQKTILEADPVIEALRVFVSEWKGPRTSIKGNDIVDWAAMDRDSRFTHVRTLQNPISLGRYVSQHEYDIRSTIGLIPFRRHNQTFYRIEPPSTNGKHP
jgi:hypothetical protein